VREKEGRDVCLKEVGEEKEEKEGREERRRRDVVRACVVCVVCVCVFIPFTIRPSYFVFRIPRVCVSAYAKKCTQRSGQQHSSTSLTPRIFAHIFENERLLLLFGVAGDAG